MELQQRISKWLNFGKKSGFTELEWEEVTLGSGLGKRAENQDRVLFFRVKFEESRKPAFAAMVLCDGMGGMSSGGECATLAISSFATYLARSHSSFTLGDKLKVAVQHANDTVYTTYHGKGGATLSAVVCDEKNEWAAVNVGDSRIYQHLNSGIVEQLTIDDTLENQLANLNLSSPPAEFRQLLQYVGMGEGIEPRVIGLQPSSEVKSIIITSDGAHSIPKDIFQAIIVHAETAKNVVERFISISEWLGGKDNSTIAVLPLSIGKKFLICEQDSSSGSFELWGIPGKIEFLRLIQDDNPGSITMTTLDKEIIKDEKPIKKNQISSSKKSGKKQKHIEETDTNDVNNNKNDVEKIAPQLSVEFS